MNFLYDLLLSTCILFVLGFLIIFAYFQYAYGYWKRLGVPFLEPKFPAGNSKSVFLNTTSFTVNTAEWYKELKKKGEKFGGVWDLCRPILVLVDPDYIRDITTKDFSHFIDRDFYIDDKNEPERNHLFFVKSHKWKPLRQKLTPTFTSGKMKMMFHSVVECSENMVDFLKEQSDKKQDVNLKHAMASFTIDVIGCCAFGLDANSFKDPNNEFRLMGVKFFHNDFFTKTFKFAIVRGLPEVSYKLGLTMTNKVITKFFVNLVKDTIDYRKKNNIHRPDFIQLLIDLSESEKDTDIPFDTADIVANTILFFVAGFDTSSTTMYFALYELARNPDIQEKARKEVLTVLEKFEGKLTYDAIGEMHYLRQVLDEALRLYPSVQTLARTCTKDYQLRDTNITIKKGTPVVISPLGLGRDPEHFPDPEKFDPDRFSPENKGTRHPYVHIPFGEGPRNCIGLRFGLMQSSIGLIQMLKNFKFSISPSSKTPLTFDDKQFLLRSNEILYLKLERLK